MPQTILGHDFREMTKADREGFAGAAPNALICDDARGLVLIFDPIKREIQAINEIGEVDLWQFAMSL